MLGVIVNAGVPLVRPFVAACVPVVRGRSGSLLRGGPGLDAVRAAVGDPVGSAWVPCSWSLSVVPRPGWGFSPNGGGR